MVPVKVTVLVPLLKVEPDMVQFPFRANVVLPALTVPPLKLMSPATVKLDPNVLNVPRFMMSMLEIVTENAELFRFTLPVKPPVLDVLIVMEVIETEESIAQVPKPWALNMTGLAAEGAALHLQPLTAQPEVLPQGPALPEDVQFAAPADTQNHCVQTVDACSCWDAKSRKKRRKSGESGLLGYFRTRARAHVK